MGLDDKQAKHKEGHGREVFFKGITYPEMSPLSGQHEERHDDSWNKYKLRIPNTYEDEACQ